MSDSKFQMDKIREGLQRAIDQMDLLYGVRTGPVIPTVQYQRANDDMNIMNQLFGDKTDSRLSLLDYPFRETSFEDKLIRERSEKPSEGQER